MTVSKLNRCLVGSLLVLSIVFPTVFFWQKAVLLAGAIFCSIFILSQGRIKVNWKLALVPVLYALVGVAYSLYGVAVGTPGAVRVLTVMVVYPLLLSVVAFTYESEDADRLFKTLLFAAWVLVIIDLIYIGSNIISPDNFFVSFLQGLHEEDAVIDDAYEYFKFTLPNVSSLVFIFPFLISVFLSSSNLVKRSSVSVLIVLIAILAIASARRALFVAAIVGPVLTIILFYGVNWRREEGARKGFGIFYLIALICVVGGFAYNFGLIDFYFDQIKSIFDMSLNDSNRERALQFDSLLNGIVDYPFFGNGAGAAASYSRSETQPWAYELSYMALMFQYGVLGFLFYFAGVLLLIYGLYKAVKKNGRSSPEYFFFSGFSSFLIANATNPYLAKFDYMWVIFIPFAVLVNGYRGVK